MITKNKLYIEGNVEERERFIEDFKQETYYDNLNIKDSCLTFTNNGFPNTFYILEASKKYDLTFKIAFCNLDYKFLGHNTYIDGVCNEAIVPECTDKNIENAKILLTFALENHLMTYGDILNHCSNNEELYNYFYDLEIDDDLCTINI